jgi:hypothetical protein
MESIGTAFTGLRRVDYLILTFLVVGIFAVVSGYYFWGRQHFQLIFTPRRLAAQKSEMQGTSRNLEWLGQVVVGLISVLTALLCLKCSNPELRILQYMLWLDLPLSLLWPVFIWLGKGKRSFLAAMLFALSLVLSGCWYGEVTSLENQDYISEIYLEQSEEGQSIYLFTVVDFTGYGGKAGETVAYSKRPVAAQNLEEACLGYQEQYERVADLGHLKQIICEAGEQEADGQSREAQLERLKEFYNNPSVSKSVLVTWGEEETTLLLLMRETW